jgi:nitrate/nitrite transporter NarK
MLVFDIQAAHKGRLLSIVVVFVVVFLVVLIHILVLVLVLVLSFTLDPRHRKKENTFSPQGGNGLCFYFFEEMPSAGDAGVSWAAHRWYLASFGGDVLCYILA